MKMQENYKPKVSVLIINHNNAKFIPKCINSIINQTYSNYEIIFFDDNSNDESLKVIKKFYKKKFFINFKQKKQSIWFTQSNEWILSIVKKKQRGHYFLFR